MCPQPLSTVSKSGNYRLGNSVLTARPNLAALVARAIAGWAVTEVHLGNAFAELIGAEQPVTMAMYSALRSFEVQRALLETTAEELLSKRYSKLFRCTLAVLNRASQHRHKFVHWIWGAPTDPHLADALLLVEPRQFWKRSAAGIRHWRSADVRKTGLAHILTTQPKMDPKFIFVYREAELQKICGEMEIAYERANLLNKLVSSTGTRQRKIYSQLYTQPEIRLAMAPKGKAKKVRRRARGKPRGAKPRTEQT